MDNLIYVKELCANMKKASRELKNTESNIIELKNQLREGIKVNDEIFDVNKINDIENAIKTQKQIIDSDIIQILERTINMTESTMR